MLMLFCSLRFRPGLPFGAVVEGPGFEASLLLGPAWCGSRFSCDNSLGCLPDILALKGALGLKKKDDDDEGG
jgi:hypothetical protein